MKSSVPPNKFNGFLIKSIDTDAISPAHVRYAGPAFGSYWPLRREEMVEGQEIEIVDRVDRELTRHLLTANGGLEIIADRRLISSYKELCDKYGFGTSTYILATHRDSPLISSEDLTDLIGGLVMLGYDYLSADGSYSAIVDDLNPPFSREVEVITNSLNDNGLFDEYDALLTYIGMRDDFVSKSHATEARPNGDRIRLFPIEDSVDLIECAIYIARDKSTSQ